MNEIDYYTNKPKILENFVENVFQYFKTRENYNAIILSNGEIFVLRDFAYSLISKLNEKIEDPNIDFEYPYEFLTPVESSFVDIVEIVKDAKSVDKKYLPVIICTDFEKLNPKFREGYYYINLKDWLRIYKVQL